MQLPPFFRTEHTEKLLQLLSIFPRGRYRIFVEVRERNLYRSSEFENLIVDEGASMVSLDSPESHLEDNFHESGRIKYVRLHGRNEAAWWKAGLDRNARYDYEYRESELTGLKNTILSGTEDGDEIFIYFNNHPSGKAPRNATQLIQMLGLGSAKRRQHTLL